MKRFMKRGLIALAVVVIYVICVLLIPPALRPQGDAIRLPNMATGERVACVEDNTEALIWRLRMIEAAREELILSTFDFGTGRAGQDIMAALAKAAERGVRVRILLDGYNSGDTLKSPYFQALAAMEGVEVRVYNGLNALTLWDANFRMHDKYLMADGSMYLIGGRNTNNLFLGDYEESPSTDRDILVWGTDNHGSGGQLMDYFLQVWKESTEKTCKNNEDGRIQLEDRYAWLQSAYPEAFGFEDWKGSTEAANGVSLICGQVQQSAKAPLVWDQLCMLMEQGSQVVIQTPYVICDDEMYEDIEDLTEGGTAVTLLTNSPETGANPFGCTDLRGERDELLDTGMTLMEYAGEASLHAKTILIDDNISVIGSFNLDMRSAYLNTETMLVVDCPELNAQLRLELEALAAGSLCTAPDGTKTSGGQYVPGELGTWKSLGYIFLGFFGKPFRYLM